MSCECNRKRGISKILVHCVQDMKFFCRMDVKDKSVIFQRQANEKDQIF